jgi:asparagine N-glycosylation enzyme membrane subunit Stt3
MTRRPTNITKKIGLWTLVVAAILMIPVVLRFPWTGSDFIFAGIALSICAFTYEFLTRNMTSPAGKIAVAVAILLFIILILGWAATGPANEAQMMK